MNDESIQRAFDLILKGGPDQISGIELLYQDCWNDFRAWCIRHGMSVEHSEDVASEAYIKVFKGISNFRGNTKNSLYAWLWTILKHCFYDKIDELKKQGQYELSTTADDEAGSGRDIPDPKDWEEQFDSIKDCYNKYIKEYEKAYRDCAIVLDLAAIQQFSFDEIGVVIDRTNAASREFVSQCKKKLVRYMNHCRDYLQT